MYKMLHCIDSEAYTSGLYRTPGHQLKYFTASSLKDIFESVDIKASLVLLKTLIFIINCSTCYQYFILAIKP